MSGFQMVGTSTPFKNRTKLTIQNTDRSGFLNPTVYYVDAATVALALHIFKIIY